MKPSAKRPTPWRHQRRHASADAQAGAAMVEFVTAALFFLLPLYLAVQALGKFADVQHMTQAGARYAAWERTVWFNEPGTDFHKHNRPNQKSAEEIQREIRTRLLNDRISALRYQDTDKKPPKDSKTLRLDPLWVDSAGQAFLSDYDKQTALNVKQTQPSMDLLGSAIKFITTVSIPNVTGSLVPPVPTQNMAVVRFEFKDVAKDSQTYRRLWNVANMPQAGDTAGKNGSGEWAGISTRAQAAVLTNAWNANSPEGTKAMVRTSLPTAQTLSTVIGEATKLALYQWQPTFIATQLVGGQKLEIGKVGVDVIPTDRLK